MPSAQDIWRLRPCQERALDVTCKALVGKGVVVNSGDIGDPGHKQELRAACLEKPELCSISHSLAVTPWIT